jgi:mono/diheme cytochrome c family protein
VSFSARTRLLIAAAWSAAALLSMVFPHVGAAAKQSNDLAQQAKAILLQRCFSCHGQNGVARKNIVVDDRKKLIASGAVVPGDAASSLLRVIDSDAMPLGGPPLNETQKATLREWVLAGAPDWDSGLKESGAPRFLTERALLSLIRADLLQSSNRDRPYLRYFSIAHLRNAGATESVLDVYRAALKKLINSLSWHRELAPPLAIDREQSVFRVDLRDYNWTDGTWNLILAAYPYGVRTNESDSVARITGVAVPYVRADWFISAASVPPLYHQLLALPHNVRELERILGVDAERDLNEERNVIRAGVRASGVSQNNRVLERHASPYGAYWKSFDFSNNRDDQNIFRDPISLHPAGSEIIFNLPNGLQGYFVANAAGARLDAAPIAIVADHNNPDDPIIRNGRSCMSCHYQGMQSFKDNVRPVVSEVRTGLFEHAKALALYPPQQTLDRLLERDRRRFDAAVEELAVGSTSAVTEPINSVARRFGAELSATQAAAESGMKLDEFQDRLGKSARLVSLGFGQLLVANGAVKRDEWETKFPEIATQLGIGEPLRTLASGSSAVVARALPVDSRAIGLPSASAPDAMDLLRSAKTVFIMSQTMFLKRDQLGRELLSRPQFQELGLTLVTSREPADLVIDLDRPVFTYYFTFCVSSPATKVVIASGRVTAFDGNFAAPQIADELTKLFRKARQPSSVK